MAKRYRIPRLVPNGTRADIHTHAPKRKRTNRRSDKERLENEPWRATGYGHDYRMVRQIVITHQHGRCADCGKVVAVLEDSRWKCTQGGQVHHKVPLCDGGTEDIDNLVLLCESCHGLRDAARRRALKGDRGQSGEK